MDMSWKYVAGFFDGEGCIGVYRQTSSKKYSTGSPRAQFVQAQERGREVLEAIQAFLAVHDIKSAVRVHFVGDTRWKRSYCLRLTDFKQVVSFATHVLPYLWVKRTECQDFLRYAK